MIVLGTKPEYFSSVWVKNEWSRFLEIMRKDKNRLIIPAYKDFDPYDLPDELSYFQALDMSRIGFVQDLLSGIKKIDEGSDSVVKKSLGDGYDNSEDRLVHNAEVYLSLDNYEDAKSAYSEITKNYPDNYKGWWGLILCETKCFSQVIPDRSRINTLYGYVEKLADNDTLEELRNEYVEYLKILSRSEAVDEIEIVTDKIKNYGDLTRQLVLEIKGIEEERGRVKSARKTINSEINDAYERIDRLKKAKIASVVSMIVVLGPVIVLILIGFVEGVNSPGGISGDDIAAIILSVLCFGAPWIILSGCLSAGIINGMKKGTSSIENEEKCIGIKSEEANRLKKTIKSLDDQIIYQKNKVESNKSIMLELEEYQGLGNETISELLFEIMKREVNADYEIDADLENVRKRIMKY